MTAFCNVPLAVAAVVAPFRKFFPKRGSAAPAP
jgi:hypothetical protein